MKKLFVCGLCSLILLFAGCASNGSGIQASPMAKQFAVTYATMKVIEKNPSYGPRIAAIAESVKALAGGDKVATVELLDAYIRSQIDWSKISSQADRLVINMLLSEIKFQLEKRIGTGPLTPNKFLVVAEVAGWIEDAANASIAK